MDGLCAISRPAVVDIKGIGGGEGGTRTPDPVIMSHVL